MPDLVYNVKFNIQSPQTGGGISQMTQQAQAVGQSFAKSTVIVDQFGNTVETAGSRASEAMGGVVNSTNRVRTSQKQLVEESKRMNSSFSSTNQLMFSLSDGFQDASQFSYGLATGMRAVGNNIGFTAELFANMRNRINEYNVANQEAIQAGRAHAKTIRSELAGSFFGSGGAILAINLAITAVTMFTRAQEVAKKKTEEAKGSINDYARALKQLRDIADPAESQRQQLEADVRNLQIAISLVKQIEEEQKKLKETTSDLAATRNREKQSTLGATVAAKDNRAELKEQEKASQDLIDSLTKQVAQYTDIEPVLSKLNGAYNTAVEVLKVYNNQVQVTTETGMGALVDTLTGDAAKALAGFKSGVDDITMSNEAGAKSVSQVIFTLDEQIDAYRQAAKAGNREVIPAINELVEVRDKLMKEAMPDLGMESKDFTEFVQGLTDDINKMFEETSEENIKEVREALRIIEQDEVESLKRRTQALIDEAERRKLEERLYWQFTVKEASVGRDTVDEINDYYNKKQVEEELKLKDQGIQSQAVFTALSLSIEAQRQNELTRLAEKGEDARREIQELTVEQQKDLYMRLVSSVSDATQAIFGQNKAVAIAEAIINTYLAASKAAASYPFPFNRIAVAAEIASGLARVATIKNTKIGSTSAGGGEQQSSSFGFTETQVQGAQQFRTPGFVPTAPSSGQMMTPKVEILADRKQLYYIVKTGEEEYRNIKAS